jgi:hypothetical protein
MDDPTAIKENRVILRRILEHLIYEATQQGAVYETLGMVDCLTHPTNADTALNYLMPRRNTAWVSGAFVQEGLSHLVSLQRLPRLCYIDALMMPMFTKTLADCNLMQESQHTLLAQTVTPSLNPSALAHESLCIHPTEHSARFIMANAMPTSDSWQATLATTATQGCDLVFALVQNQQVEAWAALGMIKQGSYFTYIVRPTIEQGQSS